MAHKVLLQTHNVRRVIRVVLLIQLHRKRNINIPGKKFQEIVYQERCTLIKIHIKNIVVNERCGDIKYKAKRTRNIAREETHQLQDSDLHKSLCEIRRLVLHNLHRQELISIKILAFNNLTKCALKEREKKLNDIYD